MESFEKYGLAVLIGFIPIGVAFDIPLTHTVMGGVSAMLIYVLWSISDRKGTEQ